MAVVYFDASALVKLLVEEDQTALAVQMWDGCDAAVSSRLAYPEVRAALGAAGRDQRLTSDGLSRAFADWEEYWAAVRPIELTEHIAHNAGDLVTRHGLRGADGVHLASALALGDIDLVIAVWDHQLRDGAIAAGLRVAPYPAG